MTRKTTFRAVAAMVVIFGIAMLWTQRAALQKRLAEVTSQRGKISTGSQANYLGMTLVDPTDQLMKDYDLSREYPGPIVVEFQDKAVFPDQMQPGAGCSFWIVESPANGFELLAEKSRSYRPKTVRELTEAILASAVTYEEYGKILDQARSALKAYAENFEDEPLKREKILKRLSEKWMPDDDAIGKYTCRVVYNYPGQKATMTTQMRMTNEDLDELRKSLKN